MKSVVIDGITYVAQQTGNRAVVVVDRGWIWAGDIEQREGFLILTRVVWVFRWESIGFDDVIKDPKNSKVMLKQMSNPVMIPIGSEIFRIPVDSNWGL